MASIKEKIGYALGDAASGGITWKIMSIAFPLYFTQVFELSVADTAVLMLVARVFDVVTDPLMGSIADRTQSRWGTYRPWLIFGSIPFGIIFALLLFTPDLDMTGKRIWAYSFYLLMMACYTMVNVPYGSLLNVMTEDDNERNQFSAFRMVGAYAMGFVTLLSFPYLQKMVGGSEQHQYAVLGALFGLLAAAMTMTCGLLTRERHKPVRAEKFSFKQYADLFRNKPWIYMTLIAICTNFFNGFRYAVAGYMMDYCMDGEVTIGSLIINYTVFMAFGEVTCMIFGALSPAFTKRVGGKRKAFFWASVVCCLSSVIYFFIPMHSSYIWLMIAVTMVTSMGVGIYSPLLWSMYADVADYATEKNGSSSTGLIFSSGTMAQKFGGAISGSLIALLLGVAGLTSVTDPETGKVTNIVAETDMESVRSMVWLLFSIFPAAIAALMAYLTHRFPLNNNTKKSKLGLYILLGVLGAMIATAVISAGKHTAAQASPIRLNQVGFAPDQEKTATIDISNFKFQISNCYILDIAGDTVWSGTPSPVMNNPVSGKPCQLVDFSSLHTPGTYTLCIEDDKCQISNVKCQICERPYKELTRAALRAYYHQRASMATEEPYAEGYARPAGHPDDHVFVHASAATAERPEGTVISSPGGWYDAGDYNKYIVNSGYTMGVWLMAYELNKAYFDTLKLNIPATPLPDMLSEAMYNIRWMMTMQDTDGGVYHKLTEPDFEGFIRPDQCEKPRYVVLKTTAATLDFAATMALAARIYAPYDPEFSSQATEAALRAYQWAVEHPAVYYDQPAMNEQYQPAITTGAYDDTDVRDEFYWAATELYLLTDSKRFAEEAMIRYKELPSDYTSATWGNVAELGMIEVLMHSHRYQGYPEQFSKALQSHLEPYIDEATGLSVFHSPYGNRESDFFWGCNSEGCCWRGVECLYAYRLTGDEKYRLSAERCLNYILGQNATGFCYVTGFGTHPTSHPHHRLSYSHAKGTLPGFLAGGPNPAKQDFYSDGVKYPDNVPADESYLDYQPSYASNEVTINWNVTLFALTAGLDALAE